ncbi:MAG TPA: hypothetical protein VJG32_22570 [Anaerolineae bacterium]|nr:hypothetical protein [Anaerolineae bacterium]
MFQPDLYLRQLPHAQERPRHHDLDVRAADEARRLYQQARAKAGLKQAWAALTGRSRRLLDLTAARASSVWHGAYEAGLRAVPIDCIRGSENRLGDFDIDFHPIQAHTQQRWVSVATAWLTSVAMPPVELIQVGDDYFVRDGHHRISVARALGQQDVDAVVTVWEMASSLQPSAVLACAPV